MDDEQEDRYRAAGGVLPGLVGAAERRERKLWALVGVLVASLIVCQFRSSSQLATCKAEKQNGFVVVLDANGDQLNVPTMSAAEWHLTDPMVVKRLSDVVSCLRGLDPEPKVTSKCWQEVAPLFYGTDAVTAFNTYSRERFPNTGAILDKLSKETISINVDDNNKPDAEVPNRYWLHWTETHTFRNGTKQVEAWAGTFDVLLEPIEKASVNSGLHIVRFQWAKALKAGEG